jgi:hypothetical protein
LIDYVKISLNNIDIPCILNLEILDFKTIVSTKTGELSTKKVAEYHFCKITIYDSGLVLFTGSIHKLWNSLNKVYAPNYRPLTKEQVNKGIKDVYKGFNGNTFAQNHIIDIRRHLTNLFNCTPQQMIFQNIEIGVNTTLHYNPSFYIKGLLYHKNIMFEYKFKRNFAQALHQRFRFKIYNKSSQYQMTNHTLRIELQIKKIEEIKSIGIRTFADINSTVLNKAKQMLLKRFDEVIHYDYTIDKKRLKTTKKESLKNYSNPRYWINDLKSNQRFRHKKMLKEITLKNSNNLHENIRENIKQKCSVINRLSETEL